VKITREKVVNELVHNIEIICKQNFTSTISANNKDNLIVPLAITKKQMRNILHKVVTALPVSFFIDQPKVIYSAIKEYIVKEYIFFQSQEDIQSKEFANYLLNFIYEITNNISNALLENDINLLNKT
jgi:hypothetical protein